MLHVERLAEGDPNARHSLEKAEIEGAHEANLLA